MGEFENLRKVGTQLSREVESELIKKKRQMEAEEAQRKRQEEQDRRRREAETQKLLRRELERKKAEEEERQREIQAQIRAKERTKERQRELEREKEREKQIRRHQQTSSTYSSSTATNGGPHSSSSSSARNNSALFLDPSKPKKQEFSFDYIAKMAQQQQPGSSSRDSAGMRNGSGERQDRTSDSRSTQQARLAAIERAKVHRGISPPRDIAPKSMPRVHKNDPVAVKRRATSGSGSSIASLSNIRGGGSSVNPIRKAAVQSLKEGLIALNTKKRDLRTIEEITADIRSTKEKDRDRKMEERQQRIREIEAERERQRLNRERAIKTAQMSRAILGSDAQETDRLKKQTMEENGGGQRRRENRSRSRSRSPTGRSAKRRTRSRSNSPPVARRRSRSPAKRRRSDSPPPKQRSKELDRRDRERERYRDRDDDRSTSTRDRKVSARRYSSSPSPPSRRRRSESPPRRSGGGRSRFDNRDDELDVSAVIGSLFGTKYRQRTAMEDISDDDMEAGADDVFREEKRSARIAREEDEREARLEAEAQERARRRRLEREKASRVKDRR